MLNGKVTGVADGGIYTNLAVADAEVEIFEVDAKTGERKTTSPGASQGDRRGRRVGALHRQVRRLLRVRAAHGGAAHHPHLSLAVPALERRGASRPAVFAKGDETAAAVVTMSRPRGYFGVGRDKFSLDGKVPPGINDGVPGVSAGKLAFEPGPRTVLAVFNNETIPARTWPVKENHLVIAEFLN